MKNVITRLITVVVIATMMLSNVAMAASGEVNVYEFTPGIQGLNEASRNQVETLWEDQDISDYPGYAPVFTTSDASLVFSMEQNNTPKQAMVIKGYLIPKEEKTGFYFQHDDGIKVMIDNKDTSNFVTKIKWILTGKTKTQFTETLVKNKLYPFTIEYFDWGGTEVLKTDIPFDWFYSEIPTYTVTYTGYDGGPQTRTVEHGDPVPSGPSVSDKTGFTFEGWTPSNEASAFPNGIIEDTSFEAVWTPIPQRKVTLSATIYEDQNGTVTENDQAGKVTFYENTYDENQPQDNNLGSSNGPVIKPKPVLYDGTVVVMLAEANDGYEFVKWKYNYENPNEALRPNPRQDFVIASGNKSANPTPVFKKTLTSITFDPNGGTLADPSQASQSGYYADGDKATAPAVSRPDDYVLYEFLGWKYEDETDLYKIADEIPFPATGSGTAVAQWEKKVNLWVATDDKAEVFFDGDKVKDVKHSGAWKDPKEYFISVTDVPFIAAKAWDTNGTANIAGFRLVFNDKDLEADTFINTNDTWWAYFDRAYQNDLDQAGQPALDTVHNTDWNDQNYIGELWNETTGKGWRPVSEITRTDGQWATDREFEDASGSNESSWIWSFYYDNDQTGNNGLIDTPVYLRSQAPMTVITVGTEGHPSAIASSDKTVVFVGEKVNLSYKADMTHYNFLGWFEGTIPSTNNPTVDGPSHYVAKFAIKQYEITAVNATGDTGKYDALSGPYGFTADQPEEHEDGTLLEWYLNGRPTGVTTSTYELTQLTSDTTLEAKYGLKKLAEAESEDDAIGTVTPSSEYLGEGETVTFTASPVDSDYYAFSHWTKDGDDFPGGANLTVSQSDVTEGVPFVAHFEEIATDVTLNGKVFTVEGNNFDRNRTGTIGHIVYSIDGKMIATQDGAGGREIIKAVPFGTVVTIEGVSTNPAYKSQAFKNNTNNPRTVTISKSKRSITPNAVFVDKAQYYVGATYDETQVTFFTEGSYYEGDQDTFTASVTKDHVVITAATVQFGEGTPTPVALNPDGSMSYTVTDIDSDVYFNILAETRYTVTSTSADRALGTVDPDGSKTYVAGQTATMTATPLAANEFVNWTVDGQEVSDQPTYSFTVGEDVTLTANFKYVAPLYQVEFSAYEGIGGSVTPSRGAYEMDTEIPVVLVPSEGYELKQWYGYFDGTFAVLGSDEFDEEGNFLVDGGIQSADDTLSQEMVATYLDGGATQLFADFGLKSYTIDVVVKEEGTGSATVNGATSITVDHFTELDFLDAPAPGYRIAGWDLELPETATASATYTVEFEAIPVIRTVNVPDTEYTLTVNVKGDGDVPGYVGQTTFAEGTVINLLAVIDDADLTQFDGWTGGVTDSDASVAITMDGDMTVTANFSDILIEDDNIAQAAPVEDILDGDTPQGAPEDLPDQPLPQTSGLPFMVYAGLGFGLSGIGVGLKRRKK